MRTLCLPIRCDCSGRTGLLSPSLSGMAGKGQLGLQVLATVKDEGSGGAVLESPQSEDGAPDTETRRERVAASSNSSLAYRKYRPPHLTEAVVLRFRLLG